MSTPTARTDPARGHAQAAQAAPAASAANDWADARAEALLHYAQALTGWVRACDPAVVHARLARLDRLQLTGLAVLLAALVPVDADGQVDVDELLTWYHTPASNTTSTRRPARRRLDVPAELRQAHATYERLRAGGQPIPDTVRALEQAYQRARYQQRSHPTTGAARGAA